MLFFVLLETFSFTQKPPRIVRALEGTWKSLIWDFTATSRKYSVSFSRQRPGEKNTEQIATRSESSSFNYVKDSYRREYAAFFPATLSLTHVKRGQNYVYTLSILDESDVLQLSDNVTVEVVGKYKLTVYVCVPSIPWLFKNLFTSGVYLAFHAGDF